MRLPASQLGGRLQAAPSEHTALCWSYLRRVQTLLELCLAPRLLSPACGMTCIAATNRSPAGIPPPTPDGTTLPATQSSPSC